MYLCKYTYIIMILCVCGLCNESSCIYFDVLRGTKFSPSCLFPKDVYRLITFSMLPYFRLDTIIILFFLINNYSFVCFKRFFLPSLFPLTLKPLHRFFALEKKKISFLCSLVKRDRRRRRHFFFFFSRFPT